MKDAHAFLTELLDADQYDTFGSHNFHERAEAILRQARRYPNDERTHELAILMDLLFEAQLRGRDNDCPWCDADLHYKDSNHSKDYCPYVKYGTDLLNFGKARPW